ncbi:putative receptor-like protein kinase At3g47110 [Camellia sinensis]|uniref:putative receptor-like protein kinase At3g47110 n=1 Tax=Camellia sinensis TaxID=4442 RepID=UPI001035B99C|nr:putative receptor-like protein kinase At3g47110 [Camellia sinensis]
MRELQLQNNSFGEEIPLEIGHLTRLQILKLNNNSIGGRIPVNLSSCANLIEIDFSYNGLVGEVPVDLGFLSKLATVIIHDTNLTGSLSPLANLSSLKALSAAENFFDGSIPDGFGQLKNLQKLAIGINRLSGIIPPSLFNLSSLTMFDVIGNQIQGSLPWVLGITLPNIEFFNIGDNQFTGLIPASISNSSKLHYLIMVQNKLIGKVPNLERLRNLEWLSISGNQLGSGEADALNFISSLINATNLQVLGVNLNNFGGELPGSIGNLSGNLQVLYLDNNKIFGSIPPGIVNLVGVQSLYMQVNQLTGLNLINNSLSGNIPSSLGNLSLLSELVLGINNFQGNIPQSLGNCNNLQLLFLSQNNLNGTIPKQVVSISSLSIYLDLSQNQLSGSLPMEVGNLVNLGSLDVSHNLLSGEIPSTLGSCTSLETLRLGTNFFNGTIPSSLSFLRGIRELDLANNNLSGEIPVFLEGFRLLQDLNLSFNNFEGVVPTQGVFSNTSAISVVGNSKLCGGVAELQLPKCNFKVDKKWRPNTALILALSIPFGLLGLALEYISVIWLWACSTVDYQGNEFKALVYEFMINGSLEEWLHQNPKKYLSNEELRMLNLLQRLNIIIDVVYALNYLHNQVQTPIVHCDLQPSNVILDKDMIGHVGDFGLAKFLLDYATHDLSTNETRSIGIRGTIGYTAPGSGSNETDQLALVAFKSQITDDPFNLLTSRNHSTHFCQWIGVTCGRCRHQRVVSLHLGPRNCQVTFHHTLETYAFSEHCTSKTIALVT